MASDWFASATITVGWPALDRGDVYWGELRPSEGGRAVVIRRTTDGNVKDVTPQGYNARTTVHEYGGRPYLAVDGTIYFSNFSDQRLYRQDTGASPRPLTPEGKLRYADYVLDHERERIICVREDHRNSDREPVNTLVGLDTQGEREAEMLVEGNDFYSSPRLSPDESHLAWVTWNHPNMPWDGNELWIGLVRRDGSISGAEQIAGGKNESIVQPQWSPEGILYFASDRTGWWNFYLRDKGKIEPLYEMDADFVHPPWAFGSSDYAFESPESIVCITIERGRYCLWILDLSTRKLEPIETPYSEMGGLRASRGCVVFTAGSPKITASIVKLTLATRQLEVLRSCSETSIDPDYISTPEAIEFPTEGGLTSYGFYYRPCNRDFTGPPNERPPLLVISHGGPTSSTTTILVPNFLPIQYWTSRGFAVLDVDYGGSTGYGRAYWERLKGNWGVVDVDDCVNGACFLVNRDEVDANRLIIRGGSAGGYTTLCALTFRNVFKAGASYYGIGDLEAFDKGTHKFESHYNQSLIGPYPEEQQLYWDRSPIHFTDRLSCPIILFQGLDDKVVLPSQSEIVFNSLRAKGLPVAYLAFEGEEHGFRKAESIKRALEAELYFYSKIFSFELADSVEPVPIENLSKVED